MGFKSALNFSAIPGSQLAQRDFKISIGALPPPEPPAASPIDVSHLMKQ